MRRGKSRGGFELLKKRIEESGLEASLDADVVAGRLKNRYPEYRRHKTFCDEVDRVLSITRHASTTTTQSPSSSLNNNTLSSTSNSSYSRNSRKRPHKFKTSSESEETESTSTSEASDTKPIFDMTSFSLNDQYLITTTKEKMKTKSLPKIMDIDTSDEKPKIMGTYNGQIIDRTKPEERNDKNNNIDVDDDEKEEEVGVEEKVTFEDLGGMDGVIEELIEGVIAPFYRPEVAKYLGVRPITGLLLQGPPGCGKTTLAHAIANETKLPFHKISAPDIMSGTVGGSEKKIRRRFRKAYQTAPSIVFIDEIEAIASKRENLDRQTDRRVVTQLMTCMDQFHQGNHELSSDDENEDEDEDEVKRKKKKRKKEKGKPAGCVLVIGATNRPDAIDRVVSWKIL